jgi:hypothetical protein
MRRRLTFVALVGCALACVPTTRSTTLRPGAVHGVATIDGEPAQGVLVRVLGRTGGVLAEDGDFVAPVDIVGDLRLVITTATHAAAVDVTLTAFQGDAGALEIGNVELAPAGSVRIEGADVGARVAVFQPGARAAPPIASLVGTGAPLTVPLLPPGAYVVLATLSDDTVASATVTISEGTQSVATLAVVDDVNVLAATVVAALPTVLSSVDVSFVVSPTPAGLSSATPTQITLDDGATGSVVLTWGDRPAGVWYLQVSSSSGEQANTTVAIMPGVEQEIGPLPMVVTPSCTCDDASLQVSGCDENIGCADLLSAQSTQTPAVATLGGPLFAGAYHVGTCTVLLACE